MYKDFKLHFSKEIAISGKSLLFNTITIYPVKSSKEEFILFQLNENGDLFVADLSFGGKFETRGSHFTFMPVQYNDKPVSVSSVLEGPYRMIYLPQSSFLLILGSIIGVSGTASIEERFGIAKLSLSSPSITSSPSFFSLQGSPIEKVSLFHRVGSYSLLRSKAVEMAKIPSISSVAVSPNEKNLAILTSIGVALLYQVSLNRIIMKYPDNESDTQSESMSLAEISVITPIDYNKITSLQWWNNELLLLVTLQGDLALIKWENWSVRTKGWQRFSKGTNVSCKEGIIMILEDERKIIENDDHDSQVAHLLELSSFRQVTPWEYFLTRIEEKEYGEASKIASAYSFDNDIVLKYKYCTCFNYYPDLLTYRDENTIPEKAWKYPQSMIVKYDVIDRNLNRIGDIKFVLTEIYHVTIDDRSGNINTIKMGLRRCIQYLTAANYSSISANSKDMDILLLCKRNNFSYSLNDLKQDHCLCFVVLMKFLLCMKLLHLRFYNSISTLNQLYTGFNANEFNLLYSRDFLSICKEYDFSCFFDF